MTQNNIIAFSIIVGFLFVAGAIYFGGDATNTSNAKVVQNANVPKAATAVTANPVRETDNHVYGNIDAQVTIVEFSDYQCPFCARLHPTLKRIIDESEGAINWEYRHLPIPSHRSAELAAIIGECVAQNVSNDAFWIYTNMLFENQQQINETFLTEQAARLGVDSDTLDSCMDSQNIDTQIAADVQTARAFGGSGTPFSVIVYADGTTKSVSGALPYENWLTLLK